MDFPRARSAVLLEEQRNTGPQDRPSRPPGAFRQPLSTVCSAVACLTPYQAGCSYRGCDVCTAFPSFQSVSSQPCELGQCIYFYLVFQRKKPKLKELVRVHDLSISSQILDLLQIPSLFKDFMNDQALLSTVIFGLKC